MPHSCTGSAEQTWLQWLIKLSHCVCCQADDAAQLDRQCRAEEAAASAEAQRRACAQQAAACEAQARASTHPQRFTPCMAQGAKRNSPESTGRHTKQARFLSGMVSEAAGRRGWA